MFSMSKESADDEQRKEFLDEIKLMKEIGVHVNIVNMLGCRTIIEPLYLVVELVPFGDLLNFLIKRREQVSNSFQLSSTLFQPFENSQLQSALSPK